MCSVVTNLVTSQEFQPIRCATTLIHIGRTRDVYVATRIILLSSTTEGSATSGYVAATERSGKVRPELVETWNGLGNTPSLFQTVVLINAACNHESFYIINLIFPYFKLFFKYILVFTPCMEKNFDLKDTVRDGRNGRKGVYFPPESASFPSDK